MSFGVSRRSFFKTAGFAAAAGLGLRAQSRQPNVVLICADDLGYGDLGCYGSRIPTPNIDRMAHEGVRFTHFYSASSVCTPARAALLTGRYAPRTGVPRVIDASDPAGLPSTETTIAQTLKGAGYRTACVGKWHLGSKPGFLPMNHGFDEFFGIPYSHDMWPRPLMLNEQTVQPTADVAQLTQQYTQHAVDFIGRAGEQPFFLYMPHTAPHIPLAASAAFSGTSGQGLYGDVVSEMDWSVGRVLQELKDRSLDQNTLVIFTSDNGPWFQGSPGRLRGRKGDTYEGGFRVPFVARFPERIRESRVSDAMASALDVMPTVARLAGAALPSTSLDGVDIMPLLSGSGSPAERDVFLYFNDIYVQAARLGNWKLHFARYSTPMFIPEPARGRANLPLPRGELYNLMDDPEESYDRATRNSVIVEDMRSRVERLIQTFPEVVVNAYNETKKCKVEDTPVNALPIQKP